MLSLGYKLRIPEKKYLHYLLFVYLFTKASGWGGGTEMK
jgi:hypothetical protein